MSTSGGRFVQLGVLCCLCPLRLVSVRKPRLPRGCLPALALPRPLITPGCVRVRAGGAEAPLSGEGPVAASVSLSSHPSLADDPEPSDDGILLARGKDLTSLSELEQFQVIF